MAKPPQIVALEPGKRVLFLTKDPELIRRQLTGELDLSMEAVAIEDLLDDINTDAMTPAWVCFNHRPEDLAREVTSPEPRLPVIACPVPIAQRSSLW